MKHHCMDSWRLRLRLLLLLCNLSVDRLPFLCSRSCVACWMQQAICAGLEFTSLLTGHLSPTALQSVCGARRQLAVLLMPRNINATATATAVEMYARSVCISAALPFTGCTITTIHACWEVNKKHVKNVGPIRHCEPPHATCSNFTLSFTRCRYHRHHYQDESKPAIAQAACDSSNTWWMAM